MSLVLTPFGVLGLSEPLVSASEDRINAEMRGLGLLETIMQEVETWTTMICNITGNTHLVS